MNTRWNRQLADGVFDLLPGACAQQNALERCWLGLFGRWGYREIRTPTLERLDMFLDQPGVRMERMVKLVDERGNVLVLRPDGTTPIARAVGGMRDAALPLRLCYAQPVFEFGSLHAGRSRQTLQAGVELIGQSGEAADAEVIALAYRSLEAAGLSQCHMEIGQVAFFSALLEEAGLDDAMAETLRRNVEEKNQLGIELLLQQSGCSRELRENLLKLPLLYGGEEVLDTAQAMSAHPRARAALESLRALLGILADYDLPEGCISIDLGMVHAIGYYTGMIFRGMSAHLGQPLLSGGRYDDLMAGFGRALPATGFALDANLCTQALRAQRAVTGEPEPMPPAIDALVLFDPALRGEALRCIEALRRQDFAILPMECASDDFEAVETLKARYQAHSVSRYTREGLRPMEEGEDDA